MNETPEASRIAAGQDQPQWKLVPVEPTIEMKMAGQQYATDTADRPKGMWWWGRLYQAMSAASPAAPALSDTEGLPPCAKCKNHERCAERGCADRAATEPAPMQPAFIRERLDHQTTKEQS